MLQQGSWSLRYSLGGFLKKTLYSSPQPMSIEELLVVVEKEWLRNDDKARDSIAGRIHTALLSVNSAFEPVEGKYRLRHHEDNELHKLAYDFLQESMVPQQHRDVLRHLQQVTHRSRGDLMSRVDLDCDWRFARLESGEWLLTEWELINDAVVEWMSKAGIQRVEKEKAEQRFEDGVGPTTLFLPQMDPRFRLTGDGSVQLSFELNVAAELSVPYETEAMNRETEEAAMKYVSEIVGEMIKGLNRNVEVLQGRDSQIPNDAVELFNREDLQGIETLMKERKTNAEFLEDLLTVVNKWSAAMEVERQEKTQVSA